MVELNRSLIIWSSCCVEQNINGKFSSLCYGIDRGAYNTRSPIDGRRLMSNDALLLLFTLFRLLLLLPSDKTVVFSFSDSQSESVFSFWSKSSFVSCRWMCGMPRTRLWAGAASGTMRFKNEDAQPHGKILCGFKIKTKQSIRFRHMTDKSSCDFVGCTHHLTQSISWR